MNPADDLAAALDPVCRFFELLGIRYYVGGSVASSYHGAMRSTMDVDLVAELQLTHVGPLLAMLGADYYASETAIRSAIMQQSSFNLIHFSTSFKVDIFVSKGSNFDLSALHRAQVVQVGTPGNEIEVVLASVEDIMIAKLLGYRAGNEVSERQWDDLTRLVKLRRSSLEIQYVQAWAEKMNVADLWKKLLKTLQQG